MILCHIPHDKGLLKKKVSPSIAKKYMIILKLSIMSSRIIFAQVVGNFLV